jgi:hypothetical protein
LIFQMGRNLIPVIIDGAIIIEPGQNDNRNHLRGISPLKAKRTIAKLYVLFGVSIIGKKLLQAFFTHIIDHDNFHKKAPRHMSWQKQFSAT